MHGPTNVKPVIIFTVIIISNCNYIYYSTLFYINSRSTVQTYNTTISASYGQFLHYYKQML